MTLLDRLLPQGWQSQVASTFGPKTFDKFSSTDFTPGVHFDNTFGTGERQRHYDRYQDLLDQGYQLTPEGYDLFNTSWHTIDTTTFEDLEGWEGTLAKAMTEADENFSDYWVDAGDWTENGKISDINIFDPDSLIGGFERAGMEDVDKNMFTPFQAGDLRALDPSS